MPISATAYNFKLETSPDGVTWNAVLEGKRHKEIDRRRISTRDLPRIHNSSSRRDTQRILNRPAMGENKPTTSARRCCKEIQP